MILWSQRALGERGRPDQLGPRGAVVVVVLVEHDAAVQVRGGAPRREAHRAGELGRTEGDLCGVVRAEPPLLVAQPPALDERLGVPRRERQHRVVGGERAELVLALRRAARPRRGGPGPAGGGRRRTGAHGPTEGVGRGDDEHADDDREARAPRRRGASGGGGAARRAAGAGRRAAGTCRGERGEPGRRGGEPRAVAPLDRLEARRRRARRARARLARRRASG